MRTFLPSQGALLPVSLPLFHFGSRPAPLGPTKVSAEIDAAAVVASSDQNRHALRGVRFRPRNKHILYMLVFARDWTDAAG